MDSAPGDLPAVLIAPNADIAMMVSRTKRARQLIHVALWTLQGWLVMFFVGAGYAKLTEPIEILTVLMEWPGLVAASVTRSLGGVELFLGLMLMTPALSWKWFGGLMVVASAVLLVLEILMLGFHVMTGDIGLTMVNVVLVGLTVPLIWFRGRETLALSRAANT